MSIQKITSIFFLILHDDKTQKLKLFICIPHTEMHAGKKKEDENKTWHDAIVIWTLGVWSQEANYHLSDEKYQIEVWMSQRCQTI